MQWVKSQKNIIVTAKHLKIMDDTYTQTNEIDVVDQATNVQMTSPEAACYCFSAKPSVEDKRKIIEKLFNNSIERNLVNIRIWNHNQFKPFHYTEKRAIGCQTIDTQPM
jgi:hypothetical protein